MTSLPRAISRVLIFALAGIALMMAAAALAGCDDKPAPTEPGPIRPVVTVVDTVYQTVTVVDTTHRTVALVDTVYRTETVYNEVVLTDTLYKVVAVVDTTYRTETVWRTEVVVDTVRREVVDESMVPAQTATYAVRVDLTDQTVALNTTVGRDSMRVYVAPNEPIPAWDTSTERAAVHQITSEAEDRLGQLLHTIHFWPERAGTQVRVYLVAPADATGGVRPDGTVRLE